MRLTGMIVIWTVGGLATGACDKSDSTGPAPATAQLSRDEPGKLASPKLPSAANRDPGDEGARRGPIDRVEAIKSTLSLMERGEFGPAFRNLSDDVVWTEVGLPDGELDSVAAIVDYHRRSRSGFSDFKLRTKRIIDSDNYQAVELVWSARHTGTLADGTPPSDKVATVPAAMLLRYKDDGLVDRVWVFQDWPNVLQQLGLSPGLASDFKPVALPGNADILRGKVPPTVPAGYGMFLTRVGAAAYLEALAEHTTDDFVVMDLHTGQIVTGRDATVGYFGARATSFQPRASKVETTVGAGGYFAAFVTSEYVYRGGYMGVKANDQKVTLHTLDIVQIDEGNQRFKSLASYGNSYEIMAALGITPSDAATPSANRDPLGIKACDHYVADARECVKTIDPSKHDAALASLDAQIAHWRADKDVTARRDSIDASCLAAAATAKVSMGAHCPRVDWD